MKQTISHEVASFFDCGHSTCSLPIHKYQPTSLISQHVKSMNSFHDNAAVCYTAQLTSEGIEFDPVLVPQ